MLTRWKKAETIPKAWKQSIPARCRSSDGGFELLRQKEAVIENLLKQLIFLRNLGVHRANHASRKVPRFTHQIPQKPKPFQFALCIRRALQFRRELKIGVKAACVSPARPQRSLRFARADFSRIISSPATLRAISSRR